MIKQIAVERTLLAAWQSITPLFMQKHGSELVPLLQAYEAHRTEMVRLLDKHYTDKLFTKRDRSKLEDILGTMSDDLVTEQSDDELKHIFEKYNDIDFDSVRAEQNDMMRVAMEEILGKELSDDFDPNSPEQIQQHIEAAMRAEDEARQAFQDSQAKRKKSAKTLEKEARQADEAQHATQSLREVYRKLAGALHPDREQDDDEKVRKTALMQRVNAAYGKNDLLQLLELQLEIEQIDPAQLNTLSDERLKHYNRILKEQLAELRAEIDDIEFSFKMDFNIPPFQPLSPTELIPTLERDIADFKLSIEQIKAQLIEFENPKAVKTWLKNYRQAKQPSNLEDIFMDEIRF
ncbi:molecular chaperone DnaJ [Chitinimonas arctica]|uniref:Molecular chaperone DnaJ n=1 Tax=Chitinimonas arctica TaxID=2594795 RepID=A0A516SF93_9NEIS|nr:molecular chaperone DnaJ [Chitinimonas arctica]QDQ26836.1 molecular chaperone DnaJ [Chitinimonas arctica]